MGRDGVGRARGRARGRGRPQHRLRLARGQGADHCRRRAARSLCRAHRPAQGGCTGARDRQQPHQLARARRPADRVGHLRPGLHGPPAARRCRFRQQGDRRQGQAHHGLHRLQPGLPRSLFREPARSAASSTRAPRARRSSSPFLSRTRSASRSWAPALRAWSAPSRQHGGATRWSCSKPTRRSAAR